MIVINNGVVVANDTPSNLAKKLEGNCLRIIVEGPEKEVENTLGNLIGVKSVQKVNCKKRGCCEFEIRGQDDVDIRRTISQYLKKSPWLLMEMTGVDMFGKYFPKTDRKKVDKEEYQGESNFF